MSIKFSAGKFEITVQDPHPMWAEIVYDGQPIHGIHHSDLRDLQYVLERAINSAREKLGTNYKHELD